MYPPPKKKKKSVSNYFVAFGTTIEVNRVFYS